MFRNPINDDFRNSPLVFGVILFLFIAVIVLAASARGIGVYAITIAAWIPPENVNACLATLANTAENLRLSCKWEKA